MSSARNTNEVNWGEGERGENEIGIGQGLVMTLEHSFRREKQQTEIVWNKDFFLNPIPEYFFPAK